MRAFWTDYQGRAWPVTTSRRRLQFSVPCHAAIRAHVFHRDGFRCVQCGWQPPSIPKGYSGRYAPPSIEVEGKTQELQLDHITALAREGSNHPTNFQTLCRLCNIRKQAA